MRPQDRAFEEQLIDAFKRAGWVIDSGRAARRFARPEILVRHGARAYAVEIKIWKGKPWKAVLRALFADGVLQARAAAAADEAGSVSPLVFVAAAGISDSMAADIAAYGAAVAPDVAWGLADGQGRFELHGPGLESVIRARDVSLPGSRPRPNPPEAHRQRELLSLFSDLGQWALKVLFAPEIANDLLVAPRSAGAAAANDADAGAGAGADADADVAPVRNVRDLARRAGISESRASDIVAALRRQGFLERRKGELALVRRPALFEAWRAAGSEPADQFGVRFALGAKNAGERLARNLRAWRERAHQPIPKGRRASLGLFAACNALDLGAVRGAPLHLLVEDSSAAFLDELGLHRVDENERADAFVLRPRFPECAFRGQVRRNGVPVADVLQVWLGVSAHPARGREQADEILAHLKLLEDPS